MLDFPDRELGWFIGPVALGHPREDWEKVKVEVEVRGVNVYNTFSDNT